MIFSQSDLAAGDLLVIYKGGEKTNAVLQSFSADKNPEVGKAYELPHSDFLVHYISDAVGGNHFDFNYTSSNTCPAGYELSSSSRQCSVVSADVGGTSSSTWAFLKWTAISLTAILLLICARSIHRSIKQRLKDVAAGEAHLTDMLRQGGECVQQLSAPMAFVSLSSFAGEKQWRSYEHFRDAGKLKFVDRFDKLEGFTEDHFTVFFSHQWTSFSHPDPGNIQWAMMIKVARQLGRKVGKDDAAVWLWVDYACIPQANAGVQALAIAALPIYAGVTSAFVVVAPPVPHSDIEGFTCNIDSYLSRAWCRMEQFAHACGANTGMMVADGTIEEPLSGVSKIGAEDDGALFVCEGNLTCCHRKHADGNQCDRQAFVVPMLGLYGAIYRGRNGLAKDLYERIAQDKARVFPPHFDYVRELPGGSGCTVARRPLFAGLISRLEAAVEAEEEAAALKAGRKRGRSSLQAVLRRASGTRTPSARHQPQQGSNHGNIHGWNPGVGSVQEGDFEGDGDVELKEMTKNPLGAGAGQSGDAEAEAGVEADGTDTGSKGKWKNSPGAAVRRMSGLVRSSLSQRGGLGKAKEEPRKKGILNLPRSVI